VAFALGKMLAPMRPDTALELLDRLNSYLRPPALDRKLTMINYARRARLAPINTGERFDLT